MRAGFACTALLLLTAACSSPPAWTRLDSTHLPKETDAMYAQARDLYYQGKFAAAADRFERTFQSAATAGRPYPLALKYKGLCYQYRGLYDQALALFLRAAEFDRTAIEEIDTLNNLGWLAYLRGDLAEARDRLHEAEQLIQVSSTDPNNTLAVTVRINLGIVHLAYGDYTRAMECFTLARTAIELRPHPMNETLLFRYLGNLQQMWGDPEYAFDCYQRALSAAARIAEQPYNPAYRAEALIDCAAFFVRSGDRRRDPEQLLQQALAEGRKLDTPRLTARALSALGDLARARGDARRALDYHRQALELATRLSLKAALQPILVEIGYDRLALDEFRAGGEAFQQALAMVAGARPQELEIRINTGLARAAAALGQIETALQYCRETIRLVETTDLRNLSEISRAAWRSRQHGAYAAMADLLAGQGRIEEALQAAERGRSRTLLEAAEESIPGHPVPETRERFLLARISRLEAQLLVAPDEERESSVVREIVRARAALDHLAAGRTPPGAAASSPADAPLNLAALRKKLGAPGELFVEFLLSEPGSHVWIVSPGGCRHVALPGQSAIEDAARRFLGRVSAPPVGSDAFSSWRAQGYELYRMLFGTEAGAVAAASRLHIAPDGLLHALPFEALPVNKAGADFEQTLAAAEIAYVPSAMVWLKPRKSATPGNTGEFLALGFGGSRVSPSGEFSRLLWQNHRPLPGAEIEARSVGEYLGAMQGKTLLGRDATEAFLLDADLARCRILHIAGHVYADENDPRHSGIFLSPGNGEDGYLCMDEIGRIRLNAGLVTLSGCQSGYGRITPAEGMISLARAFLGAGAGNVIMSVWKTDDEANLEFMRVFYRELSRGVRPSKALQETRRWFFSSAIPAYRHPYFWAAFLSLERGDQSWH